MIKPSIWFLALTLSVSALAEEPATLRIGSLAFGTLGWELSVMHRSGLDKANGVALATTELASPEAGRIALQGKSVDVIVSDWIWVARQRQQGHDFTFAPFSSSHGALMVPADSPIKGVADLRGKRLGVAGGGLDKNWLLLKALGRKASGVDLEQQATVTFGAPPLLNQSLLQGQLDAVLTYWNYAAKLEAAGYRRVLSGREIQQGLGIDTDVPVLGYVFREGWAQGHGKAIGGFLRAAAEARRLICEDDAVWQTVAPLTRETDGQVQAALRRHYCAGRVQAVDAAVKQAAGRIYQLVDQVDGTQTGNVALPAGVFWSEPGR